MKEEQKQSHKKKKKNYSSLTNAHTHTQLERENFTLCCCVTGQEGEGPTEEQGSECHISTNTAFYMRLLAL